VRHKDDDDVKLGLELLSGKSKNRKNKKEDVSIYNKKNNVRKLKD